MNHSAEIDQPYDQASTDLEPWHQDDTLGPQKRCICVFQHSSYDGTQCWNVLITVGLATNEEKAPLVEEIAAAGSPLNDRYFIDAENLELWIDQELAGLCRFQSHGGERANPQPNTDEPLTFLLSLDAVFVRPRYHSLGFGELLSEQLAELVTAGVVTHLFRKKTHAAGADVALYADFDSFEGERFFDHCAELIELNLELVSAALAMPIHFSTDAGY